MLRVILSRKGFDSSYGGYPSPILPDGTLLSLPIPSPGDGICYSDLQYNDNLTYYDIMKQLKPSLHLPHRGIFELTAQSECHLDPDLIPEIILRSFGWNPLFGQINQAQSHLDNMGVMNDDLFLFFGWFKQTEWHNSKLRFIKNAPDLHIIHGYLQIANIVHPDVSSPEWMQYHPHLYNESRINKKSNTIYIAKDHLSWNSNLAGASALTFDTKLVLTKPNRTRSIWQLPDFLQDKTISYHSSKSWKSDGSFQSAKIGQEFVIQQDKKVTIWAKSLIS